MDAVPIHEATTHVSRLVARAEAGEEIAVRRGPKPVAKIVAYQGPTTPRSPGALNGQLVIADDFDKTGRLRRRHRVSRLPVDTHALIEQPPAVTADAHFGEYGVEARW